MKHQQSMLTFAVCSAYRWLDYHDFPVDKEKDNAISTTEFLEAAESLTTLFGTTISLSAYIILTIGLQMC